ncbi:ABC transporter substrate-binding protein [Ammoniphilus sp. YIM 78166]|uniref:ABC transporter substrate-binding protein n=1 Tax=Ammoniphilus sp. YIM 78166 TaxID=1644106 RepID=UPI00106FFB50|nr:ABC transporter substrate-binding protein [Ammoniphilus sp. YIM 78166]
MSKKAKYPSLLLALLLGVSTVLSACSSSKEQQATNAPTDGSEAPPYEVTVMIMDRSGQMADLGSVQEEVNKMTKEKINATVNFLPIGRSAYLQQMNLMMAGSEKLDLVVTSSYYGFSGQVSKGQLLPLNELLEKHGSGIKEVVRPEYINATKVNGNIYGVPSIRDLAAEYGAVVRKDIFDKYNIDSSAIKTWEDLEKAFEVIQKGEPGMAMVVGTAQAFPVAEAIWGGSYDILNDRLGVLPEMDNNLKVENLFETQKYREAVDMARRWYQKGYIMQDVNTSQEGGVNLVKAGKVVGYVVNMKPGMDTQESRNTGMEMLAIPLSRATAQTHNMQTYMMSISKNSRNPEKAMEFMNLLYTDKDIMNLITNGIEGQHYVKKSDQVIAFPSGVTAKDTKYLFNQFLLGNNFLTHVWETDDPQIWEKTQEFNDSAIFSKALGFTFSQEPVKSEVAAVTNVINQYRLALENGTLDVEKNLKEFNTKLKEAGLDKIIAEKQKQLDDWMKTK